RVPAPPCTALLANVENSIGASGGANGKTGAAGNAPATNAAANGAPGGQGRRGGAQGRPGQAEQRPVLAGLIEGGYVEIRDGLRSDEIIVSDGLNKMQPGQPVNFCAAQLPQSAAAGPGAGRPGMGGRAGAGGRGGGAGTAGPGALGRPGGQSGGGSRQGRQGVPTVGAPVGRIAGASS
ncbi:MAG TPA: hypothetical protein VFN88_04355, partial [Caulobacteraceae bacterium]|nr:hypothetical protein [Caulobacteraceae bacterium]